MDSMRKYGEVKKRARPGERSCPKKVWNRFGPLYPARNIRKPLGWSIDQITFAVFGLSTWCATIKKNKKVKKTNRM
jgi:hypothetical protein